MQRTKIEYLTHTWSPIAMRCTPVSSGCDNCLHLRMANRMIGIYAQKPMFAQFKKTMQNRLLSEAYSGERVVLREDELSAPLRRREPAVIGVNFMGDLFHNKVTNGQIAAVFGVMAACPQHKFLILTKRPERALNWTTWMIENANFESSKKDFIDFYSNVWFGVSIEDQKTADERIPLLLQIPAAVRWVSAEPLLDEIDLGEFTLPNELTGVSYGGLMEVVGGDSLIDWVTCGAETGPGKRHMNLDHARSLRDQCKAASVPFHFKRDSDGCHTLDGFFHEEMPCK